MENAVEQNPVPEKSAPATTKPVKGVKAAATKKTAAKPAKKVVASKPAPKKTAPAKAEKPVKTVKAEKVEKTARPEKAEKPAKTEKLVRDSFTIPRGEYALLQELKTRIATLGRPAKKSEVLRAGIQALKALDDAGLLAVVGQVPVIKTGRPSGA